MSNLRNQSVPFSSTFLYPLLIRIQSCIRQEIVDDDPWDQETIFPYEVPPENGASEESVETSSK